MNFGGSRGDEADGCDGDALVLLGGVRRSGARVDAVFS